MKTNNQVYTNVKRGLAGLAIAAMLAAPMTVLAGNDDPKAAQAAVIRQVGNFKFQVALEEATAEAGLVFITDEAGNVLYKGILSKKELAGKVFDLSQLADGKYKIEVQIGKDRITHPFAIQTQVSRVLLARN